VNLFDLSGRRALVTGASRGIGLAITEGFAEAGSDVVITGRKLDSLKQAVESIQKKGRQILPVVCHQGDPAAIANLFHLLDQQDFTPDAVVINAATNPTYGSLLDTDPAAWQKTLEVNLTGAWLTAQQAGRRMIAKGGGSLIFISSLAGLDPFPGLGAYNVSKAGLIALAKTLAKELAPKVRVNAIAPGLIETRFSAALFENRAVYDDLIAATPLKRHGQPQDVVGAVIYLASNASAYVTGQVLEVDGGAGM
jgi:NAD(P)-dependent dehydrogenase (short-subunit alcohol dehydrogenase family)